MYASTNSDLTEARVYSTYLYRLTSENLKSKASELAIEIRSITDPGHRNRLERYVDGIKQLAKKLDALAALQDNGDVAVIPPQWIVSDPINEP